MSQALSYCTRPMNRLNTKVEPTIENRATSAASPAAVKLGERNIESFTSGAEARDSVRTKTTAAATAIARPDTAAADDQPFSPPSITPKMDAAMAIEALICPGQIQMSSLRVRGFRE